MLEDVGDYSAIYQRKKCSIYAVGQACNNNTIHYYDNSWSGLGMEATMVK